MRPRAIWAAYEQANDALSRECPNCGAAAKVFCTADDGRRVRRIPCLARGKPASNEHEVYQIDTPERVSADGPAAHDFGEPRHPVEAS